ncbi:hypothetical protein U8607_02465 [Methylobacterium durans]|uniref:hypothetical protein n=1 Tax=Methylobacterium durans TaxID=2202825 RepID=UPI002AFFA7F2|nr:hypothetical protein [Methylobacterium durans]MEA1830934.1 hypothetical protein [Methylobacterium durans]
MSKTLDISGGEGGVVTLQIYGREPASVFSVFGSKENTATLALGWCLEHCPALLAALLDHLQIARVSTEMPRIELQQHGDDGGFTDIEIIVPGSYHIIIEAKKGWILPSAQQLGRYVARLHTTGPGTKVMVSVSAASEIFANHYLPSLNNAALKHLSWAGIRRLVRRAHAQAHRFDQKLWLRHLDDHLGGYVSAQDPRSNLVYVVTLSDKKIWLDPPYTWIDVVALDRKYFHPFGGNGWPSEPPTYMGFRYAGQLQSVHHVEAFEVILNLQAVDARWPDTSDHPHFLYTLGPPMKPAATVRTGNLYPSQRVHCMIDTLLSGAFESVREARDETKRRLAGYDA